MATHLCLVHRYGYPDIQGWVTCWSCGHTFNVVDNNDDDDDVFYDPEDDPNYEEE